MRIFMFSGCRNAAFMTALKISGHSISVPEGPQENSPG